MSDVRNIIVIGSGPSGYSAAVYAARSSLAPLVFEGSVTAGGALMNTTEVENFPGFRDGIMGPALMDEMRAQAERFGAELVTDDVTAVDLDGEVKVVVDGAGNEHQARAVILAMGSSYKKLGLPAEDRLSGHGVSWCQHSVTSSQHRASVPLSRKLSRDSSRDPVSLEFTPKPWEGRSSTGRMSMQWSRRLLPGSS